VSPTYCTYEQIQTRMMEVVVDHGLLIAALIAAFSSLFVSLGNAITFPNGSDIGRQVALTTLLRHTIFAFYLYCLYGGGTL